MQHYIYTAQYTMLHHPVQMHDRCHAAHCTVQHNTYRALYIHSAIYICHIIHTQHNTSAVLQIHNIIYYAASISTDAWHTCHAAHRTIQHNTYAVLCIHSTIHVLHYIYTAQYICSITNTQHNILCCITQYRCMTYLPRSAPHNKAQYGIIQIQHRTCPA